MTVLIPILQAQHAPKNATINPLVVRFIAVAIVLCGFGMLIGMWWQLDRARRTEAWPTTTGQIVQARTERHSGDGGKRYSPIVRYAYAVDGTTYESERYAFGSTRRSKESAEALCAEYPPGSEVAVHYDPAKPAEAVLVVRPAGAAVPLGIAGALLMAVGGFVFTLGFRFAPPVAQPIAAST